MDLVKLVTHAQLWSQPPLAIAVSVVVMIAFIFVAGAVVVDFRNYHRQNREVVGSDRSFVETGSMTAFFVVYYLVIRFSVAEARFGGPIRASMIVVGLVLVVVGVLFNVWGRILLKSSWANQIRIYAGQELLTTGPFKVVRHPLYASLIWIFIGGSLVYSNALACVLTLLVFVPMMYVRAHKEDALLLAVFGMEFEEYRRRTGLFLPKIWR